MDVVRITIATKFTHIFLLFQEVVIGCGAYQDGDVRELAYQVSAGGGVFEGVS